MEGCIRGSCGNSIIPRKYSIGGIRVHEPIAFANHRFTATAFRWDAFEKEAYAAYFGVHYFGYYLRGKPFILEIDYRNLLWIQKLEILIVIRWRVYLQSFIMYERYIPGTQNTAADWFSRMERYFHSETACEHMSTLQSDISVLLHMTLHSDPEHDYMSSANYGAQFETLTAFTGSKYDKIDYN